MEESREHASWRPVRALSVKEDIECRGLEMFFRPRCFEGLATERAVAYPELTRILTGGTNDRVSWQPSGPCGASENSIGGVRGTGAGSA